MLQSVAVTPLVESARMGDSEAWNTLVERYLPLVSGVIARHRLRDSDAADVNQTVWLRLVEHLNDLREPEALPGWLATTTQRECLRVLRAARRYDLTSSPEDSPVSPDQAGAMIEEE